MIPDDCWFVCGRCGAAFYVATGADYLPPRLCSLRCLADELRERPTTPDIPAEEYDAAFPPQSRELPDPAEVAADFAARGESDPFLGSTPHDPA